MEQISNLDNLNPLSKGCENCNTFDKAVYQRLHAKDFAQPKHNLLTRIVLIPLSTGKKILTRGAK